MAAITGRLSIPFPLSAINDASLAISLKPIGNYYMEDFHAACGLGAVLREFAPLLDLECCDVAGIRLRDRLSHQNGYIDRNVIHALDSPVDSQGGIIALFGSLYPDGAICKRAAADPRLLEHTGRAVVFDGLDDLAQRIDQVDLDVREDDIFVLKNAGPVATGMPEAGYFPSRASLHVQASKTWSGFPTPA